MTLTVVIAAVAIVTEATPASAHSVSGVSATNFDTRFKAVTPALPGVRVAVVEAGSRLEVVNTNDENLIVLGYLDEPYLRIGPRGVYENLRSPATYVNASRSGESSAIPASADPEKPPRWRKVSDEPIARFHDHRIHWMGSQDPPAVRRDPRAQHVIVPRWEVPMRLDGRTLTATGSLVWVPGPDPLPWLGVALAAGSVVVLLARRANRSRPLAAATALLLAVDVFHAVGNAFANAGTTGERFVILAKTSPVSVVGWVVGILAVVALARKADEGVVAAGVAGAFAALIGGVVDFGHLSNSVIPFAYGAMAARACVALSLGLGIGLATAAVLVVWRGGLVSTTADEPAALPSA